MSTGLTWVIFCDPNPAVPEVQGNPVVFSDYWEARSFVDWYLRLAITTTVPQVTVAIYTSSPNQNGYGWVNGASAQFSPFD
jgi:hypothetical protein